MHRILLGFAVLSVSSLVSAQSAPQQTPPNSAPTPPTASARQLPTPPQPQPTTTQLPTQASPVGEHASSMAPEHVLMMGGEVFGECISELASTGECPHMDGPM
jgi:hypothetical protein